MATDLSMAGGFSFVGGGAASEKIFSMLTVGHSRDRTAMGRR